MTASKTKVTRIIYRYIGGEIGWCAAIYRNGRPRYHTRLIDSSRWRLLRAIYSIPGKIVPDFDGWIWMREARDDGRGIEGYDFEHCEWFGIPDDDLPNDCPLNAELCGDCTRYEDCDTEIERKKRERR